MGREVQGVGSPDRGVRGRAPGPPLTKNDSNDWKIPEYLGVVLAGGLARRMGGGDKPLREIGGQTILARVIARLEPQCEGLIISANGDPLRFAPFGLPVIADGVKQHPGPLAGILAGLDWAAAHSARCAMDPHRPGRLSFSARRSGRAIARSAVR